MVHHHAVVAGAVGSERAVAFVDRHAGNVGGEIVRPRAFHGDVLPLAAVAVLPHIAGHALAGIGEEALVGIGAQVGIAIAAVALGAGDGVILAHCVVSHANCGVDAREDIDLPGHAEVIGDAIAFKVELAAQGLLALRQRREKALPPAGDGALVRSRGDMDVFFCLCDLLPVHIVDKAEVTVVKALDVREVRGVRHRGPHDEVCRVAIRGVGLPDLAVYRDAAHVHHVLHEAPLVVVRGGVRLRGAERLAHGAAQRVGLEEVELELAAALGLKVAHLHRPAGLRARREHIHDLVGYALAVLVVDGEDIIWGVARAGRAEVLLLKELAPRVVLGVIGGVPGQPDRAAALDVGVIDVAVGGGELDIVRLDVGGRGDRGAVGACGQLRARIEVLLLHVHIAVSSFFINIMRRRMRCTGIPAAVLLVDLAGLKVAAADAYAGRLIVAATQRVCTAEAEDAAAVDDHSAAVPSINSVPVIAAAADRAAVHDQRAAIDINARGVELLAHIAGIVVGTTGGMGIGYPDLLGAAAVQLAAVEDHRALHMEQVANGSKLDLTTFAVATLIHVQVSVVVDSAAAAGVADHDGGAFRHLEQRQLFSPVSIDIDGIAVQVKVLGSLDGDAFKTVIVQRNVAGQPHVPGVVFVLEVFLQCGNAKRAVKLDPAVVAVGSVRVGRRQIGLRCGGQARGDEGQHQRQR